MPEYKVAIPDHGLMKEDGHRLEAVNAQDAAELALEYCDEQAALELTDGGTCGETFRVLVSDGFNWVPYDVTAEVEICYHAQRGAIAGESK